VAAHLERVFEGGDGLGRGWSRGVDRLFGPDPDRIRIAPRRVPWARRGWAAARLGYLASRISTSRSVFFAIFSAIALRRVAVTGLILRFVSALGSVVI